MVYGGVSLIWFGYIFILEDVVDVVDVVDVEIRLVGMSIRGTNRRIS